MKSQLISTLYMPQDCKSSGAGQLKIDRLEEIAKLLEVESKDLLPGIPIQHFESVTLSQIGNGYFINNVNDKERKLFETVIDRQQEEINYLKSIIDSLKK